MFLAATQVPVDPSLGVLAALLALVLIWTHRSRFVPYWLPAEAWHELERREGTRLEVVTPVAAPVVVAPEQLPAVEDLPGALLELQGEFEAAMQKFTAAAESEWTDLEHQLVELHTRYQVVRGQLAGFLEGKEGLVAEAVERGQELRVPVWPTPLRELPPVTEAPVEPPLELSGVGWREPDEKGLRSRSDGTYFEYLGAPNVPDQPASAENPRPYYREGRPGGFVEIARGVVAGKRLLISDCARYLETVDLFPGDGVALEPGGRVYGASQEEAEALEKVLWTLPADVRARLGQLTFASDLGGRVDWAGTYRADEDGFPRSIAALCKADRIALRADLSGRPRMLARALRAALGLKEPVAESGVHDGWKWVEL